MAAVLEKKDPAAPFASQVDEQIAQATSRIRAHDLAFGGLLLAALVLIYTTAMIVLDKSLALPEWVRQVSLAGFGALFVSAAYFALVRPIRKRINPLYAAKQVENTLDDNKNSVTGYVDAQEKGDLNPTVKAALASRAAKAASEADVNKAVDHRSLVYVGAVVIAFLLALIVLFFVFRSSQFASLFSRTFYPFSSTAIDRQTHIDIVKPDPAETTITAGQSVTVAVHISGKVPKADSPQRVRLMIRHNPADPNYDELPMVQGDTTRDFELRVPDYLVQNGFWYKIAAGDDETPEYRVTVRSVPTFTEIQTTYEYPKYLRRLSDTATDPIVRAYRGTKVTMIAKTNRDVRDGMMVIEPGNTRVPGAPVPGKPDSLQFVFKVTEAGRYKLTFNSTTGETTPDVFAAAIKLETDQPPQIVINKPEEDETQVPANGQIVIDGKVGDDFGIDTVTLKMKIVEPANLQRELPDVPYMNGKVPSFRREDNTWPTDLVYKGSVDLAKLNKDAAGLKFDLEADMVIEFWLEATDNCSEPKPNVGKSAPKRVRLTPPKTDEMDKQEQNEQKQNRQNEEKQHNQQQKQKLDNEKREPQKKGEQPKKDGNQQPEKDPNAKGDPKNDGPKQPGDTGMKPDMMRTDPKMPMDPNMAPMPKSGDKDPPKKNEDPNAKGMDMGNPMNNMGDPKKPDDKNGMGDNTKKQDNQNAEKTADEFAKDIEKENKNGGAGKPNPTPKQEDRDNPGEAKPQPKDGMMGGDPGMKPSEPKPEPKEPKPNDPMNMGMGQNDGAPSQSKNEGKLEKGADPATPKPEQPKQPDGMGQKNSDPSQRRGEPAGAPPGTDKEPPKDDQPEPKGTNQKQKQDPKSGSAGKPSSEKPQGGEPGMPDTTEKKDPAGQAGSGPKPPMRDPTRGNEKPTEQPKGPPPADEKPDGDQKAGSAKPDKAPPAGEPKPKPSADMMNMGGMDSDPKPAGDANDPKKPNGTGSAETKPDDQKNPPMGAGDKSVEKGKEKPQPKEGNDKGDRNANGDNNDKKIDPEQMKKLEEAAKNLNSPDPKKKEDAQKTLDKAIGKDKREELEKLAKDLQSPDEKTRQEAQKKLEQMAQDAKKKGEKGTNDKTADNPKLDEKDLKEIADAMKDLQSGDMAKKQEAQKKLDEKLGEQNRKELEKELDQLSKDLKSDNPEKKAAAEKKLKDLQDQLAKQPKDGKDGKDGPKKEPSPEEIADLAKKAQDLNSKDDKKREQAEKDLDDKIGKKNREELQEKMKNQKPDLKQTADDLKKKMEDWQQGQGSNSPPPKGRMDDDKANRLKAMELNLENFEKDEYRKKLQASKGWTDDQWKKFMDDLRSERDKLRDEIAGKKPVEPAPFPKDGKTFTSPDSGRVGPTGPPSAGNTTNGGATTAPPGFEGAREKFEKYLDSMKKKP